MTIGIFIGQSKGEPGSESSPILPADITAIASFHLIGNDAVVDGGNVLTSWQERKSATNVNIQGTSIATTPNHTDSHRSVNLNGTSQGFYVPMIRFQSFYIVHRVYRSADDTARRIFHTSANNTASANVNTWFMEFSLNRHNIARDTAAQGNLAAFTAEEIAITNTEGILVKHAYRAPSDFFVNDVEIIMTTYTHNLTIVDPTYTQIGYKAEGDNAGAFGWIKSEILEMIGFTTEATVEQHNTVMTYLSQQYPSIV